MLRKYYVFCGIASLIFGLLAGVVALALGIAVRPWVMPAAFLGIFILALLEEVVKISSLFILAHFSSYWMNWRVLICSGVFLGLGFGLFEVLLIFLGGQKMTAPVLLVVIIHSLTGLILATGVLLKKRQWSFLLVSIILAVGVHVWYNQIVNTIRGQYEGIDQIKKP